MPKQITLDTGCITLLLGKNPPKQINNLFDSIINGKNTAHIITPVISEVFKHLCVKKGKDFASSSLISMIDRYPIVLIDQDLSLLFKAGDLKCQYRTQLSYIDCFVLAAGLLYKWEVHTTEKNLPDIPHLKVINYHF